MEWIKYRNAASGKGAVFSRAKKTGEIFLSLIIGLTF